MVTQSPMLNMQLTPRSALRELRPQGWSAKTGGAVLGLCGGIIAPAFASLLTTISWFTGSVWHGLHLHRDGTFLFFLTIPLLVLGAHCLDLIDKEDEEARNAYSGS